MTCANDCADDSAQSRHGALAGDCAAPCRGVRSTPARHGRAARSHSCGGSVEIQAAPVAPTRRQAMHAASAVPEIGCRSSAWTLADQMGSSAINTRERAHARRSPTRRDDERDAGAETIGDGEPHGGAVKCGARRAVSLARQRRPGGRPTVPHRGHRGESATPERRSHTPPRPQRAGAAEQKKVGAATKQAH